MTTFQERVNKLAASLSNPFIGSNFQIAENDTKLGRTFNYIHLHPSANDKAKLESNIEGAGNPGFTFSSNGSELRTGPQLKVGTSLPDVVWGNGLSINPLLERLPPNIVNHYPVMIPNLGELVAVGIALRNIL